MPCGAGYKSNNAPGISQQVISLPNTKVITMNIFQNKRIVLGVTGSIAAYKSVALASRLTQAGASVDVVLTEAAARLVGPITFSSVTGRRAFQDQDLWQVGDHVIHIDLGENNQAFIIAPATANTIAKLAQGIADNLLTLSALASRTELLVAPAMDGGMFQHPATQKNLTVLQERGVTVLGPAVGHLASGLAGKGRMLEPENLLGALRVYLGKKGRLSGKKVMVTAGGTREPLDPVRLLTNRSSGKQGYALAQAALDQGAEVLLISAPSCLDPPEGVDLLPVESAGEMRTAVMDHIQDTDVLIMAAAVADYRPSARQQQKIKKGDSQSLTLSLERTPDILQEVAELRKGSSSRPAVTIGFAAETEDLMANARRKLKEKRLDLLAANDVSAEDAGFETDTNRLTLLGKDGWKKELPLMGKGEAAERIISIAADLLEGRNPEENRED